MGFCGDFQHDIHGVRGFSKNVQIELENQKHRMYKPYAILGKSKMDLRHMPGKSFFAQKDATFCLGKIFYGLREECTN